MTDADASVATALDERPLPWILAQNVDEGTPLRKELDSLGATVRYVRSLEEVRQVDYSIFVCVGVPNEQPHKGLKILQFFEPHILGFLNPYQGSFYEHEYFKILRGAKAARFKVGDVARALGIEPLVTHELLKNVPAGGSYNVISLPPLGKDTFQPLVQETGGEALAGILTNRWGSQCWMLPAQASSRHLWLRAALAHWRSEFPGEFPAGGQGIQERWKTRAELQAEAEIAAFEVETQRQLQQRERERLLLVEASEAVALAAESHERRLLNSQGDDLVSAVSDALSAIGFTVSDSDAIAEANKAAKREDLQVTLQSRPGWVALVEVKGYAKGGAKMNDLRQLAKAAAIFEVNNGREPDAQWYVVNAMFSAPPDDRPVPLESNPDDVELFAGDGGLVVDTRQVFLLLKAFETGDCSAEEAQKSLVAATGTYFAPALDSTTATSSVEA